MNKSLKKLSNLLNSNKNWKRFLLDNIDEDGVLFYNSQLLKGEHIHNHHYDKISASKSQKFVRYYYPSEYIYQKVDEFLDSLRDSAVYRETIIISKVSSLLFYTDEMITVFYGCLIGRPQDWDRVMQLNERNQNNGFSTLPLEIVSFSELIEHDSK